MGSAKKKTKEILFAVSECVPFIKSGGLADVGGSLPAALAESEDVNVSVIMPLYSAIPENLLEGLEHVCDFYLRLGWRNKYCGIEKLVHQGITYYFVDNRDYFFTDYLYGYGSYEAERFAFFCTAVLEALPHIGTAPDIIHCHDWQTAMIPPLLKTRFEYSNPWNGIKTVFTIHNLKYQGVFNRNAALDLFGLDISHVDSGRIGHMGDLNFMKGALTYADRITTVSPTYASEIMTPWAGEGLDSILLERKRDVEGILNGIDVESYNPRNDPAIESGYSAENPEGKRICKKALMKECGFTGSPGTPILGMVGRLVKQKGLDLVERVLDEILQEDIKMVVLGTGDEIYSSMFRHFSSLYRNKLAAFITFDQNMARRIYAGSDMFLMPSHFEPCGLAQLICLRYGTLPIARETGGLKDTVFPYDEETGKGNGFTFTNYNAHDMLFTIQTAVDFYKKRPGVWKKMQANGMKQDFSWKVSAKKYIRLYDQL